MATSQIKEVSINTQNAVPTYAFKLANGQWHNITKSYMDKVLASKLGAGTSHLILTGAMVEYSTVDIKNGDAVIDDNGKVVEGKFYKELKAPRKKVINFEIDWEGVADKYLTKKMNADSYASALVNAQAVFANKPKFAATPEGEPQPALQTVKPDEVV